MLYSVKLSIKSKGEIGTSLVVQYLGPQLPVLGMQGLISGWGDKIQHVLWAKKSKHKTEAVF